MKHRDNVGLFVVDFKQIPNDFILLIGDFLEKQDRMKIQYEDYGKTSIRMTPISAKILGYNLYAAIIEQNRSPQRIQIYSISTKTVEHLEAAGSPYRLPGTSVTYQLFFQKHQIVITGTIVSSVALPQGIIKTAADLEFSPELVEIINHYWYNFQTSPALEKVQ
jgi:hypothetical protein